MAPNKPHQSQQKKFNPVHKTVVREKAVCDDWRKLQQTVDKPAALRWPAFKELKNLIIFLLFNFMALLLLDLYPVPPETLSAALGIAPPAFWINIACIPYVFTEFILTLCRERKADTDRFALKQLLFLSAFYLFYWSAGALQEQFAILLVVGSLLQLLEAFARRNPLRAMA